MYKKILVAIDNSFHSNLCIDYGIELSKKFNSLLIGCHVYDARLHQRRFRDMEKGLPPQYQDEKELHRQRNLHTTLINKGLELISESYLDVFRSKCKEVDVPHKSVLLEGKNYYELIKEIQTGDYDLVLMGARGLAAVNETQIGSVCERVIRRIKTDVIVVKDNRFCGKLVVAVDGSPQSIEGINSAINYAQMFNMPLEAVSVFDPHYHRVAFESIAKVLSEDAGQIFRFKEQETLHEEIIDKGLAKIYQNHLDRASQLAQNAGIKIKTVLKDGKPYDQILKFIRSETPSLIVMGRTGVHNTNGLDLGSTTENLLRLAPCNILLTGGNAESVIKSNSKKTNSKYISPNEHILKEKRLTTSQAMDDFRNSIKTDHEVFSAAEKKPVQWTEEAQAQTDRIPSFIRSVVRKRIEAYARENGYREVTTETVNAVNNKLMKNDSFHSV